MSNQNKQTSAEVKDVKQTLDKHIGELRDTLHNAKEDLSEETKKVYENKLRDFKAWRYDVDETLSKLEEDGRENVDKIKLRFQDLKKEISAGVEDVKEELSDLVS